MERIEQPVGNTPLVKLPTKPGHAGLFIKLEGTNPGGSIKDRVAKHIIDKAEISGRLRPYSEMVIVEASGGSMAHGLLSAGGNRYRYNFFVPQNYSQIKILLLEARGATVTKVVMSSGNDAHYRKARELAEANPISHFFVNQLHNLDNPEAHYLYTGTEIISQLGEIEPHYFITGIGSGGTISGVGRRLKERYQKLTVFGVQPAGCDVIAGKAVPHRIQGWGVGLRPSTLDASILDDLISVNYYEAIDECDYLNTTHGLFLGISSGANVFAARQLARKVGADKTILTLSPDGGVYYGEHYNEFRTFVKNLYY